MAEWHPIQNSFSGGQVSPKLIMRTETEQYAESVLEMRNFMPTLQGTAERTPGPLFILEIADEDDARLIPYLSILNEKALVQITDRDVVIYRELVSGLPRSVSDVVGYATLNNPTKQIIENPELVRGGEGWTYEPLYGEAGDGDQLGVRFVGYQGSGALEFSVRRWRYPDIDPTLATAETVGVVDVPTDRVRVRYRVIYRQNFTTGERGRIRAQIKFFAGGQQIGSDDFSRLEVGDVRERDVYMELPFAGWTGKVTARFELEALEETTTPVFLLDFVYMYANAEPIIGDVTPEGEPPWRTEDLKDIHYVQSPHGEKELVLVHPNYPPHWLYYDQNTAKYVIEPIEWQNDSEPTEWFPGNYPSTCTSFQGRLVLAGTPQNAEKVWCSVVDEWDNLTEGTFPAEDFDPASGFNFTTTFRSPIEWLAGHKALLCGAVELEYVISAQSGFVNAGDLAAEVHSSHGGAHVQPVGFGQFVVFAAERGTRARAIQLNRDNEGWIAPDLNLLAPDILQGGIIRMARMRNPHQMIVFALGNGQVAIVHQDSYARISGWSILDINAEVQDLCVIADEEGRDVLFMVVRRTIQGVKRLYIEAIPQWTVDARWTYLVSYNAYAFLAPTSVITGLEHLEGQSVQVVGDGAFLGGYKVKDGQITLQEPSGLPIEVGSALVGLPMVSSMTTMPAAVPPTQGGAGSKKRYSEIGVRVLFGSRPIINGDRVPARDPDEPMNQSQQIDILRDNIVTNLGWDEYQFINVRENKPVRCEILGIYGKLNAESL